METVSRPPMIPRATYRLQLNEDFGFDDAAALVPYLAALGVSHIYSSPFLKARPGSTHGYDITDHNAFNPEIGDAAAFERLVTALHERGMGLILDFVPNHMGVGGADNPWWLDVLEWGRASPFADFFDINWNPAEPSLKGKVLVPSLGDHYGKVLESGELQLRFDRNEGSFSVWYYDHRFPIAPRYYARILRLVRDYVRGDSAETVNGLRADFAGIGPGRRAVRQQAVIRRRADELKGRLAVVAASHPDIGTAVDTAVDSLNGTPGEPRSFRGLHDLLEIQAYRLAYWRVATAEINYRRFFDINDLAGLRMENPELFEVSHQLVFRLIAEGGIQGLRIDHIDGLYDPAEYCRRLQDRAAYMLMRTGADANAMVAANGATEDVIPPKPRRHPFYLLVEKILARHERLREDWPVDGTTGYDYINQVNGLFVDAAAERPLTETYDTFIGRDQDFERIAVDCKRQIVQGTLDSEIAVLASEMHTLANQSWSTRDYTLLGITAALIEIVTHFPVYRTYITEREVSDEDRRYIDWAVTQARKAAGPADPSVFDFLHSILTTDLRKQRGRGYKPRDIIRTAMKFQQVTGPAMAKSIEDTAFYRYFRLTSLNEVGGEPTRFGVSPAAFHHLNQERLRHHPDSMVATATHDHKRGEDTRARINVLTEMPEEWDARVTRWAQLNARRKQEVDGVPAPGANAEYLLYQTLVGVWPLTVDDPADAALAELAERMVGYMTKAIREAKWRTSWTHQNVAYEEAVERFTREVLDPARSGAFLADLIQFQGRLAVPGAINGLAQTLLKLTSPGVPDIYRGTEFWDLSLVDPDNRRPVDYPARSAALEAIAEAGAGNVPLADLLAGWRDGRVKQYVIARTLGLRRRLPALFSDGSYHPLEVTGERAEHLVAFQRRLGDSALIVVVPRLVQSLVGDTGIPLPPAEAWGDTAVASSHGGAFRNVMTGATRNGNGAWPVADLLDRFPVALLHTAPEEAG